MTSFWLKIIACVTMLIDHIGSCSEAVLLRCVGRLSFPIFAFLITQGFLHTKNFKKYLLRIFAFALLSEIPYDLCFRNNILDFKKQNIFFTLTLGLICIYFIRRFKEKPLVAVLTTVICCVLAHVLKTDYGYLGVLTIAMFYILQDYKTYTVLSLALISVWPPVRAALQNGTPGIQKIQILAVLSLAFIFLYNGKRGYNSSLFKYGFYAFYPLHLLFLHLIFN